MKTRILLPAFILVLLSGCDITKSNLTDDENVVSGFKATNGNTLIATDEASCVGAVTATLNGTSDAELPNNSYFYFYFSPDCTTANQLLQSGLVTPANRSGSKITASLKELYLDYGKKYYFMAVVKIDGQPMCGEVKTFTTQLSAGPAVDMGLSVKWASCNVGASNPEQPGGLYQWAGTTDVTSNGSDLTWQNCPYHSGKDYKSGWTKYVTSDHSSYWSGKGSADNKKVLDSSDDIAHVKLGGKWRMPTYKELNELYSNCTATWMTINGKSGFIFTSDKEGYTGSCIFLPAAGWRDGKNLYDVGTFGYYWASTICDDSDNPAYGSVVSFRSAGLARGFHRRYYAYSVRPVQPK